MVGANRSELTANQTVLRSHHASSMENLSPSVMQNSQIQRAHHPSVLSGENMNHEDFNRTGHLDPPQNAMPAKILTSQFSPNASTLLHKQNIIKTQRSGRESQPDAAGLPSDNRLLTKTGKFQQSPQRNMEAQYRFNSIPNASHENSYGGSGTMNHGNQAYNRSHHSVPFIDGLPGQQVGMNYSRYDHYASENRRLGMNGDQGPA